MSFAPSPHKWSQVRRLPLCPEIDSLAAYDHAVMVGDLNASAFLRQIDPVHGLRVGDFQQVHYLIFKKVHPWAGQFRITGQMAIVAGYPAADPQRINRELEMSIFQTSELLESPSGVDDTQLLAALAFLHVRFERVHPFLDGNGRTGRAVLAAQCEALFGKKPAFEKQTAYRAAMRASGQRDLAPLISLLAETLALDIPTPRWSTPYRVAPRFMEQANEPSFIEDIAWSRLDLVK
jgi:fido (protein-threonine AMPylation protein)